MGGDRNRARSLTLLLVACLLIPGASAADRRHRLKYKAPAAEVPEEKPEDPEGTAEEERSTRPYLLHLLYGRSSTQPGQQRGPLSASVPKADDILALFDRATLGLGPQTTASCDEADRRCALRLRYLREKLDLFDELLEIAADASAVADSLTEVGQWSEAARELVLVEERKLEVRSQGLQDRVARVVSENPELERLAGRHRLEPLLPETQPERLPEQAQIIWRQLDSTGGGIRTYSEDILPRLETMLRNAREAHSSGQVGLLVLLRARLALLAAREERLELDWLASTLALDFEQAGGQQVAFAEDGS